MQELNILELEFCMALNWDLSVKVETLQQYYRHMVTSFGGDVEELQELGPATLGIAFGVIKQERELVPQVVVNGLDMVPKVSSSATAAPSSAEQVD